jgi:alpha-amylase
MNQAAIKLRLLLAVFLLQSVQPLFAQESKKVILQGFWWDFKNNNYPQGWANYLIDLAPRLRKIGIEGVWVPVNQKNANPNSVGYSPFDHYDLGDKFQKSNLKTPFGDKDEYLRMVGVLHRNGMDVIQDVVLNHIDGAGSSSSSGGVDSSGIQFYNSNRPFSNYQDIPNDPTAGFKNFRYVSFLTPASSESRSNYINRSGRWPKNWQNFNPGPGDNRFTGDDLSRISFGPDVAFYPGATGLSSLGGFNPAQSSDYMRNQARAWMVWLKKQTGIDGFRLDAIKHFPSSVMEDILWNLQNNAGSASGTDQMFAVGEWVGGKSELDAWVDAVQGRAGTFDFGLRGFSGSSGLFGMVYGMGGYDLSNLPGTQQDRRYRTVPFVNNHDTFRPNQPASGSSGLQANGNYPVNADGSPKRWNSNSELSPNIDPREPRLTAAYAIMMSMDGHPTIFFEDLFDIGTTGKRYTHLPSSETDLPVRQSIANLIRCHKKFDFKAGPYRVRSSEPSVFFDGSNAQDLLVFERGGKAIIAVTDNFSNSQAAWIDTDFPVGTVLKDYTGNFPNVTVVTRPGGQPGGRVRVQAPSCNGMLNNTNRKGVAIYAPASLETFFNAPFPVSERTAVHEWEMANDLGDSHARSLRQGGELPALSTELRLAGKIFAAGGKAVAYKLFPSFNRNLKMALTDECGRTLDSVSGTGALTKVFIPSQSGWYQFQVQNVSDTSIGQRVWVQATYTAPDSIDALSSRSRLRPFADLGPDRYGCTGTGLSLNPGFSDAGLSFVWRDGQGNQIGSGNSQPVTQAGLYSVTINNTITGCTASDTVRIISFENPPPAPLVQVFGDTIRVMIVQPGLSYSWRRNGVSNPADTLSYFVMPSGTLSVNLTTRNVYGCTNVTANLLTAVPELLAESDNLHLFPNPASGSIFVSLPENAPASAYQVIDFTGRLLLNGKLRPGIHEIDLRNISPGLYLFQSGSAVRKFRID